MRRIGDRAVVLGASIGGLVAARVLTEAFAQVTLVDRDELPDGAVPRRGVPQGHHTHALLGRGREVLEELFPGLTDELMSYGARGADLQDDVRFYNDGHLLFRRPSGMRGIGLTRPLLEDRLRARVRSLPRVELRTPVEGEPVLTGGRVTGVRVRPGADGSPPSVLDADLVVDATGRGSHTPAWLESAGFPRPAETTIELGVGYSTWIFPHRPIDLAGDSGVLIGATVPVRRRGRGGGRPVDGHRRWLPG
jgi:2-polyprenyl-6-methoxyphenol hydroxylase-like FAD-dependent oxidoreductase